MGGLVLALCLFSAGALAKPGRGELGTLLVETRRDLGSLLDAELHGQPDELWAADPAFALQVMILRAGRELPPTVSAARRSEREAARRAALDWLRGRQLQDPTFADEWSRSVSSLLQDPDQEVLWRATARTLGRLLDYGHSRELARGLSSERPQLAHAASGALFDLYLRWFTDPQEFQHFWDESAPVCDSPLYRDRAREFERQARELQVKLLEYEPQRGTALLSSVDPRMRAAAARSLGASIDAGSQETVSLLLQHLEREVDGAAFHAMVEALLETQAAAEPEAAPLAALRQVMSAVVRTGPAELQGPAAYWLGRSPWSVEPQGEASILGGIDLLAAQLQRLEAPGNLTDRDVLVTSLQALSALGERAARAGLELEARVGPVRELVLRSIREEREFEGVRVAAARLLPIISQPQDIQVAVEVMGAPSTSPGLVYTLLADVGEMARGVEPEERTAALVLDTLLGQLTNQDPDLRRRALSYLGDADLAALTARANPKRFIDVLGSETLPELQVQLLALVAEYGRQDQVGQLLELQNFDAIVNSGPAGMAALVQTLEQLTVSDPDLVLRAAERLLAVANEDTRVSRLREALTLVGKLDSSAAAALSADGHDRVVAWARELRSSAGSLPGGKDFLRRLVSVHIPGCSAGEDSSGPNLAHVRALFLSDLFALDPESMRAEEVLTWFENARAFAAERGRDMEQALVLRDRARFHLKQGAGALALSDYRAVFAAEAARDRATPEAGTSVLDLSDLRRGGELVASSAADARTAGEALLVSLILLGRDAWSREPAAVRAQDLRDFVQRALRSETPEACELALGFLDGLPELPAEVESPTPLPAAPAGASWEGLLADRAVHQELLGLDAELRAARELLSRADDTDSSPDTPDESSPESPGEGPEEGTGGAGEAGDDAASPVDPSGEVGASKPSSAGEPAPR